MPKKKKEKPVKAKPKDSPPDFSRRYPKIGRPKKGQQPPIKPEYKVKGRDIHKPIK